ncbi:DUF4058 family protein [Planctomicrobium piriforme]|uniref:DUF4058 domain-containing protein n=1 Tax=Planctomicrobium piriforme TaxID=1576369 RepID=A0A1I3KSL6_9PLAN|nr:DUF4058 family protein [Planctomicrobium piriforme]SFI75338.1 Protein of unknown function [Planctomicrobium piriforme]
MPGPFPGMDPWLENRRVWKGFHDALVVKTIEVLQPGLVQAGYYIEIGDRVWISEDDRELWPDNLILRKSDTASDSGPAAAVADQPVRLRKQEDEMREIFAEVYTLEHQELVTVLEFLSPTNKRRGKGRNLYLRKQKELRSTAVHLVEIDLLRGGTYTIDAPQVLVAELKPWDYLVNIARRGGRDYEIYPVRFRSRLPRIAIPLKTGDQDTVLDLQQLVDWAYGIGAYESRLDYRRDPVPPLNPDDAAWADEILKSKGLR